MDVRGGAPGTRETDLLNPINLVEKVHAIVLAGGSAFGLDAANGVMRYLEENKIGFNTGVARVPIVPSAILFDLALVARTFGLILQSGLWPHPRHAILLCPAHLRRMSALAQGLLLGRCLAQKTDHIPTAAVRF